MIDMFIKLTEFGKAYYVNENEIRKFYSEVINGKVSNIVVLQYGTMVVDERPEEIMEMLKEK